MAEAQADYQYLLEVKKKKDDADKLKNVKIDVMYMYVSHNMSPTCHNLVMADFDYFIFDVKSYIQ
jgi:hypothetical protein